MGVWLCLAAAACDDAAGMADRACDGAACEGAGASTGEGGPGDDVRSSSGGRHLPGADSGAAPSDGGGARDASDDAAAESTKEACGPLDDTPGDCRRPRCDAHGTAVSASDDDDAPEDDGNRCTAESCDDGSVRHLPEPAGTTCAQDGGGYCDGLGACVECVLPEHCESGVCQAGECQPAPCGNGELDEGETDIDCGGDCGGCGPEKTCIEDADCAGMQCDLDVCAPNCDDGVLNQGESDIDCGAACSGKPCANGLACGADADCEHGFCNPDTGVCATPSCSDGLRNGTEIAIDCDGVTNGEICPACPIPCMDNWQCDHGGGLCYDGRCVDSVNGCTQANATDLTHMVAASQTTPITIEFGGAHGDAYVPRCLKVTMGSTIEFVGSFATHPLLGGVVEGGTEHPATTGPFTELLDTGSSQTFTLDDCASYPYYCANHGGSGMNGAVIVLLP